MITSIIVCAANSEKDFAIIINRLTVNLKKRILRKCARRGVEIQSTSFVVMNEYIDKKTETLFKCAIYIGCIGDQIPQNKT
jgi:hypothetical protein